jgi:small subunit ribosomal protein S3
MLGVPVHVNIEEVRKPELDAQLIADSIAQQLEKRIMFRRAMKRAMQNAMRLGAQGIKIMSPAVSTALKSHVASGIAKAACRCIPCAPISTTVPRKPRPPMASSVSRSGCSRARCMSAAKRLAVLNRPSMQRKPRRTGQAPSDGEGEAKPAVRRPAKKADEVKPKLLLQRPSTSQACSQGPGQGRWRRKRSEGRQE